jgi:NAD-dependent DNA ligase
MLCTSRNSSTISSAFEAVGRIEAGSKLEKARALGVEVIDEAEFMKRIG